MQYTADSVIQMYDSLTFGNRETKDKANLAIIDFLVSFTFCK